MFDQKKVITSLLLPFIKQLTIYILVIFRNHIDGLLTLGQII